MQGQVNAAALDTGSYPVTPSKPPSTAGSVSNGRLLEGQRMANYVVVPTAVDPALARTVPQNTSVLETSDDLPESLPNDVAQRFVVGFSTGRQSAGPPSQVLINMVLRFTDPAAADAAARDMAAQYWYGDGSQPPAAVSIPGHRSAVASGSDNGDDADVESVSAHGPYVLYQYALSDGLDGASALVAKTLDLQEPLIDRFAPVDPSKFADLPVDDTGLMSRTLPVAADAPFSGIHVYLPAAALHFRTDPIASEKLFAATNVQAISMGRTTVFETADAQGAQRVAADLVTEFEGRGYHGATGVTGLPVARCFDGGRDGDSSPRRFFCVGYVDRYAFAAFSNQERDAHQQLAAQYLMLTAAGH
jgi:hypothetical protein